MKYAMLSTLIPKEFAETFRHNSKHTMQDAANVLQWNLYEGLCTNIDDAIPLFNVLPVGSYPQYYRCPSVPTFSFDENGQNIGFCNIKLIRNYAKEAAIIRCLKRWCASESEEKLLFVYTLSQPMVSAAIRIKKLFPDLRICAIVADLPEMSNLSSRKSLAAKMFSMLFAGQVNTLIPNVDFFVLLTKHMADYLHLTQPYCVVEGIASEHTAQTDWISSSPRCKTILYSGTLHRKFGVLHLVKAFSLIQDQNYQLIICGIGDSEKEIRAAALKDSRIRFMGQLSREEILRLQTHATILVNPRLNNEEFTKYSFPSKTMEYLASGKPVVAYKLDGIPDEYDDFLYYPSDNTPKALASTLIKVCEMSDHERQSVGKKGQSFVLTKKNKYVQTKIIFDLISSHIDV